ncbi:MAG: hypothetical protein RXP97_04720, partial [Nitrososphaeria archaeon]
MDRRYKYGTALVHRGGAPGIGLRAGLRVEPGGRAGRCVERFGLDAESLRALLRGVAAEIFEEKGLAVDPKVDERAEALLLVPSDDLVLNVDTLK